MTSYIMVCMYRILYYSMSMEGSLLGWFNILWRTFEPPMCPLTVPKQMFERSAMCSSRIPL